MQSSRLAIALALVLAASPSSAAWVAVGTILNANDGSAAASWAPVTSATLEVGNVAICVLAKDETGTGTTDSACGQSTTTTDAAGNTWIRFIEWCNMQTSTAENGATVSIWLTAATTQLTSGAAITFNFSASTTRKAATCMEFTATHSSYAGAFNVLSNDAADPGSLTTTTLQVREHLFVRGIGCESNVTTYTADTDYIAFTGQGAASTSDSGTAATSMGARGEYRIATEAVSAASDPTYATADCASAMTSLNEGCATRRALTGVGCR